MGKNLMSSIVKHVCNALNIYGDGASQYMTTHGLRATMISLLIAAGHSDASVLLCSGHRDANSLKSYHNLRGRNGMNQLGDIFNSAIENNGLQQTVAPADYIVGIEHEEKSRATKVRKLVDGANITEREVSTSGAEFGEIKLSSIFGGSVNPTNCNINVTISKK